MSKQAKAATPVATPAPVATPVAPQAITCLCWVNPKKVGSASHTRFQLYASHSTVADYVAACIAAGQSRRNATADIAWDLKHGFIAVA